MKQTIALMAMMALFFAVISFAAQAQGRGGGQGKGRTTTTGQGGGRTVGQVGRPSGQPGKQPGQGQMDQDRLRAHTTDQQRDRLRDCVSAADQARQRAIWRGTKKAQATRSSRPHSNAANCASAFRRYKNNTSSCGRA